MRRPIRRQGNPPRPTASQAKARDWLGETLAVFERCLPAEELPTVRNRKIWDGLPSDPRRLLGARDNTA
jgi:hypothetical protein